MLAVAVVAVLLGGYLYLLNREPGVRYARAAARFHAEWEQRGRANAQWAEKRGFLDEVDLNRRSADQHKALKLKWLAAPWRPWAKIPPDPYASDIQGDPEG